MLTITRKKNEVIRIADNIKLTVVDIKGNKIRLGIEAPKEIPVRRPEVYENIQKEDFRFCLQSGKYEDAYSVLLKGVYRPTPDELSELKNELTKMGKLDKSIEDKLSEIINYKR